MIVQKGSPAFRWFLVGAAVVALVLAACAPAATPTAAPKAPVKAAATSVPEPAKPAATAAPPAAPAATAAPAAKPAAATPAGPAEVRELRLGLVRSIVYGPIFLAVERGAFLKHGFDVKIKQFSSGAEATKALQAGDVDVATVGMSINITARNEGIKYVGIVLLTGDATVVNRDNNLAIIAHPNSGITKVEDLVGKRVSAGVGTDTDKYLKAVLAKSQIPADKIQLVNTPIQNSEAAMAGGSVDAAATWEPYGEILLAKIPGSRVVTRNGGVVTQRIIATGLEDWLEKNRPVAERFAVAYADAAQYARQHLDEAGDVSARWLDGVDAPVARKAIRHVAFDPRYSWAVEPSWNFENETLLSQKKIKQAIPLSEGFATAIPEKVLKERPELFSDLGAIPPKP